MRHKCILRCNGIHMRQSDMMKKRDNTVNYKNVNLPEEILNKVDKAVKNNSDYSSRAEYVKRAIINQLNAEKYFKNDMKEAADHKSKRTLPSSSEQLATNPVYRKKHYDSFKELTGSYPAEYENELKNKLDRIIKLLEKQK